MSFSGVSDTPAASFENALPLEPAGLHQQQAIVTMMSRRSC
jgi:hypothetical protein